MLINGWDIKNASARQACFVVGHHSVSNNSEWSEGSNRPIFQRGNVGFKKISIELWVKGNGYQEIVENRGKILSRLLGEVVLEPDWTDHKFKATIEKYSVEESSKKRFHVLKLEFLGYEYGDIGEYSTEVFTQFFILNPGTMETPVSLELTPLGGAVDVPEEQMTGYFIRDEDGGYLVDDDDARLAGYDHDTLTIEGLCTDPRTAERLTIVIRNVVPEEPIVIDGESGLITQGGAVAIDNVDIWALPTLQPGENLIKINNNWLRVKVRYHPRFM